jgi:hypothetical protein
MVIEMLLNNDIFKKSIQMILHFQKEINVIMYTIEFFYKKICSKHARNMNFQWIIHCHKWSTIMCFYHVVILSFFVGIPILFLFTFFHHPWRCMGEILLLTEFKSSPNQNNPPIWIFNKGVQIWDQSSFFQI